MGVAGTRWVVIGFVFAMAVAIALGDLALAALDEDDVLTPIHSEAAVLRLMHRKIGKVEYDLGLVQASLDLTERQYEAQKKLYDDEIAKGDEERAAIFKPNLDRLERHMGKLKQFDFETIYAERITKCEAYIAKHKLDLEARIIEFKTLFGKDPVIEFDFEAERERESKLPPNPGQVLRLD